MRLAFLLLVAAVVVVVTVVEGLRFPLLSPPPPAPEVKVCVKRLGEDVFSSLPSTGMVLIQRDEDRMLSKISNIFEGSSTASTAPFRSECNIKFVERDFASQLLEPLTMAAASRDDEGQNEVLEWLSRDIREQVELFEKMLSAIGIAADGARVKFELQERAKCPRYHTDKVPLRTLCTYTGPGTQWLAEEDVDRRALFLGAPNESICLSGRHPHSVPAGSILAFFGGADGVVHRSPDVPPGRKRLLLTIDPESS
jgi:hypothetical protein